MATSQCETGSVEFADSYEMCIDQNLLRKSAKEIRDEVDCEQTIDDQVRSLYSLSSMTFFKHQTGFMQSITPHRRKAITELDD
jgi:hypothetical protein